MNWYFFLNRKEQSNLLDNETGNYVVCKETPRGRKYAFFKSVDEIYTYLMSLEQKDRCMYEVIFGESPHKIYFDIDGKGISVQDGLNNLQKVIDESLRVCKELGHTVSQKNVMVFTSSNREKQSYHVVLRGYCVQSNVHVKEFVKRMRGIDDIIDMSMYSSKQNFRMLYCQKLGTDRTKIPLEELNGIKLQWSSHEQDFRDSLVYNVESCTTIDITVEHKTQKLEELPDEVADILEVARKSYADMSNFEFLKIHNNILYLKRIRPSYCKLCKRTHEHENSFIVYSKDNYYFVCRRNTSSLLLTEKKIKKKNSTLHGQMYPKFLFD